MSYVLVHLPLKMATIYDYHGNSSLASQDGCHYHGNGSFASQDGCNYYGYCHGKTKHALFVVLVDSSPNEDTNSISNYK